MNKFIYTTRVYAEDTDYGGVVYHANYLKFMERARTEYLIDRGYTLAVLEKMGFLFVIFKTELQFLKPAKLNDMLTIHVDVANMGNSSLTFSQSVYHSENEDCIYCQGQIKVVCVDKNNHRPTRIPKQLRENLV